MNNYEYAGISSGLTYQGYKMRLTHNKTGVMPIG